MKILLVYAHPEPQSFNGSMFKAAIETLIAGGHDVKTSDLYAMGFDPVSSRSNFITKKDGSYYQQQQEEQYAATAGGFAFNIEAEIQKLEWCDLMIWQFPLWWFGLPAILKGWVDRVFALGRVYGNDCVSGVFEKKKALISLTTGSPKEAYSSKTFNGEIQAILRPIEKGMLEFVKFNILTCQVVHGLNGASREYLEGEIHRWSVRLQNIEEEISTDIKF